MSYVCENKIVKLISVIHLVFHDHMLYNYVKHVNLIYTEISVSDISSFLLQFKFCFNE